MIGEAATRVEDALVEVEVAHEVVQARRAVGRAAEEDSRVAQDLAQPQVGEPLLDVRRERTRQQGGELRKPAQHLTVAKGSRRLVRVVQESRDREVVRIPGGVEVRVQLGAGSRLDALEQPGGGIPSRDDVDRRRFTLGVHPVGRGQGNEVELVGSRCSEQPEEVLEDLRHEVPARPGVEAEAVGLP